MNKSELIQDVAQKAKISKADAASAVNAVMESVTETLTKGDSVTLIGFGTFSIKERAARTGRNPRDGKPIQISASKIPSFKAGKSLKDAVQ
jgi:DNA-binding protein HU-beta